MASGRGGVGWVLVAVALSACKATSDADTDGTDTDDTDVYVAPDVVINELMASNATGLQDASGAFPDWIELHNAGDEVVDLSAFSVTDDPAVPQKWSFPAGVTLGAGEHLILFADGDPSVGDEIHTSFSLSRTGETVQIIGPATADLPVVDEVFYPPQGVDISWARQPDGTFAEDPTPTPGEPNG